MRPLPVFLVLLLFALSMGCSRQLKVVADGPSVHDQLTGRGYIAPPVDTLTRNDTAQIMRDTLR